MKVVFTWEKDDIGYHAYAVVRNQKFLIFGSNDVQFFYDQFRKLDVTMLIDFKDLHRIVED